MSITQDYNGDGLLLQPLVELSKKVNCALEPSDGRSVRISEDYAARLFEWVNREIFGVRLSENVHKIEDLIGEKLIGFEITEIGGDISVVYLGLHDRELIGRIIELDGSDVDVTSWEAGFIGSMINCSIEAFPLSEKQRQVIHNLLDKYDFASGDREIRGLPPGQQPSKFSGLND